MFILRWLGRLVRPFSILKKYLLTLAWMLFVAVLYFALQVPVKTDCQVKCLDDNCQRLAHLGCPQKERTKLQENDTLPTSRPRQNFIEYLLSQSDQSDREDSRVFLQPEDRGRHELPPVRFLLDKLGLHRPSRTKAPAQSESRTDIVTDASNKRKELFPSQNRSSVSSSLNEETSRLSQANSTGTISSPNIVKTSALLSNNTITVPLNVSRPTSTPSPGNASKGSEPINTNSTKTNCSKAKEEDTLCLDLVEIYFEDERRKCATQDLTAAVNVSENNVEEDDRLHDNVNNSRKFCPCIPPNLVGRLAPNHSSDFYLENLLESEHQDVKPGGEWQPSNCRSRTRLAIVVPYRDRLDHLKIFLRHMLPILKKQLTHFRIFVAEQNDPAVFNKAAMMNIGFLEAMKQFQFDCVIFHDVDILMEDDRSLLNCGDTPHHYAISLDRWNYSLKYEDVFGAVISLRPEMFNRSNGFSNSYFGWGGEDDDMGRRVRRFWKVFRPPMEVGRYITIKHTRDSANAVNKDRMKILKSQMKKFDKDGLNSIRYKVKKMENFPLFTWILADLDVSKLPYPAHDSFSYNASEEVCIDDQAMTARRQRSRLTCQYDCDQMGPSCVGFKHRVDGLNRECWLITGNCTSFEAVTHERSSSQTYLKKMEPVQSSGLKTTKPSGRGRPHHKT